MTDSRLHPLKLLIFFSIALGLTATACAQTPTLEVDPIFLDLPEEPSMTQNLPVAPERLNAIYRLQFDIPGNRWDGEIVLLPDSQPCEITATLRRFGMVPEDLIELDRSIQWPDSIPALEPLPETDEDRAYGRRRARFTPPSQSRHFEIPIELTVQFHWTDDQGERRQGQWMRRETIHLLTPVRGDRIQAGMIEDYKIGEYLAPDDPAVAERYAEVSGWPALHPERYQRPTWFYRVDEETKNLNLTPNMDLGFWTIDFPWKSLGMPQYIALDWHLVQKIEDLITLMRGEGFLITRFKPIYGFRSPAFNLGTITDFEDTNLKVPYSMHQYGRAVDMIIDEDGDEKLDDLNGDGQVDIHDAAVIMHYVNRLDRDYRAQGRMQMVGGAGLYTHNDFVERTQMIGQTPYIHVDTRGFLSEDGTLIRWPNTWPDGTPIRWGSINRLGYPED